MYTKCVLTALFTTVDSDFSINLKQINGHIRGTMYTKCVLTVPLTTVDSDFFHKLETN